ncbi:MAG: TIGR03000 domain-containing protein [Gemmataceae bacterium]
MYSIVLMAALSTGSGAPEFGHHGCGHHGYNCGGWVSSTCTGCYGGSYYGAPYGPGCLGGWYGAYCGGGCWGGYGGGCYGGGIDYNGFGCQGCYGCYGGFGCGGYSPYGPAQMVPETIPAPKVEDKDKKGGTGSVAPDRAKVIVQLPADAKLYVDDQPIKATPDNQVFNTPQLERGQTYFYEVRAEAVRDGKTVVESKRILVRAGQEVTVAFPKLEKDAGIAAVDPKKGR